MLEAERESIAVLNWEMSEELVQALILGPSTVVAALLGIPRLFKDHRSDVLVDLQIFQGLPDGSAAKGKLLARIEEQLDGLDHKRAARRDPAGIAIALIFLALSLWMGISIVQSGGPWLFLWPVVASLLLLGVVGLLQDGRKHVRDAKGRPIR